MNTLKNNRGFTMIEASIVITVLAAVTAFVVSAFFQPLTAAIPLANQVIASDRVLANDLQEVVDAGEIKEGARENKVMISMIEGQAGGRAEVSREVIAEKSADLETQIAGFPALLQSINDYISLHFGNVDFGALYNEFLVAIGASQEDVDNTMNSNYGDLTAPEGLSAETL